MRQRQHDQANLAVGNAIATALEQDAVVQSFEENGDKGDIYHVSPSRRKAAEDAMSAAASYLRAPRAAVDPHEAGFVQERRAILSAPAHHA